ncbi:MAG: SDR family oxidoreductase [Candidatus Omnitrophica bacterium]|nr:SDR family oxidoreductase [Candidatus Omnitrophota bacterium]
MIDPGLQNKCALITGANHGIGAAVAKALAMQGANIFISYFREDCPYSAKELQEAKEAGVGGDCFFRAMQQQSAESVLDNIRSLGVKADVWESDLGNPDNIPKLFDRCETKIGPVDVLVNNHTYDVLETFDPAMASEEYRWFGEYNVQLTTAKIIDETFAVNTRAYTLMMKEYLLRYLKRNTRWGRIINISCDAAHCHEANISYAASKHAIESYSRSAATEMGKYGITVNILSPGPIQTGYMTPEMVETISRQGPLRRVGEPADIADAAVFLASEQARWVTGQLLYVGGGWRMHQ